jgi:hypothetical protein
VGKGTPLTDQNGKLRCHTSSLTDISTSGRPGIRTQLAHVPTNIQDHAAKHAWELISQREKASLLVLKSH